MTRVNSGIPVDKLPNQLLLAELREIMRIPYLVKDRLDKGIKFDDIPTVFTLNAGHVKFFYNKLEYIEKRYLSLLKEYELRGKDWNNEYTDNLMTCIQYCKDKNKFVYKDWIETIESKNLLTERLIEKIPSYKRELIIRCVEFSKESFKNLLLN